MSMIETPSVTFPTRLDKKLLANLPKATFTGRIFVVNTEEDAIKAVNYLNTQTAVGIDTETRPSFQKGQTHKVALMQISTADTCFLFRLNRIGLPDCLLTFLANGVLKIGLSLKDDFFVLNKRKKGTSQQGAWVELQQYVPAFGIQEMSLQKIYAILFGEKISKSQRLTNWENDTLTPAQTAYAALDAYACLRIYQYIEELKVTRSYAIEEVATL